MLGSAEATQVKKKIISLTIKAKMADFGILGLFTLRTDSIMFPSPDIIEAGIIIHHRSTFKNQMNDSSTVIW